MKCILSIFGVNDLCQKLSNPMTYLYEAETNIVFSKLFVFFMVKGRRRNCSKFLKNKIHLVN